MSEDDKAELVAYPTVNSDEASTQAVEAKSRRILVARSLTRSSRHGDALIISRSKSVAELHESNDGAAPLERASVRPKQRRCAARSNWPIGLAGRQASLLAWPGYCGAAQLWPPRPEAELSPRRICRWCASPHRGDVAVLRVGGRLRNGQETQSSGFVR